MKSISHKQLQKCCTAFMRIARPYLFFIVFLISWALRVCSQNISFKTVTPPEDFTFAFVSGITQDISGYMWFTSGQVLYRYNGYEFTTYKNDPLNTNSLAGIRLECVYADKSGFIWIGDVGAGLDRLDPRTGVFKHHRHNKKDSASISNDSVITITEDHEGYIWVGTLKGLNRLNKLTGKFTRYEEKENDSASLSDNEVRALYEDKAGTMWVGTGTPFFSRNGKGGLNRFERKTGKFTRYLHNPHDPHSLIDNRVGAICEDSRGVFWVGTAGDGLHTMDRAKGTFERLLYDSPHPEKLSRPPLKKLFNLADDHITFLKEDVTGEIWIGTFGGGLNRYDPETKRVWHYEAKNDPDSLHENATWKIYSSREGVIWMSSWEKNLYRINPLQKHIPHYRLLEGRANAFVEEASDILWIGTVRGGLLRNDRSKGIIKRFINDPNNAASLSHNIVNAITKDQEGNIWIGTNKGLNLLNRDKQTFTRFLHDSKNNNSLIFDYIITTYADPASNLWIGTSNGLDYMIRRMGTFTHYSFYAKYTSNSARNYVAAILQDSRGNLWAGGFGLHQLDRKTAKFKNYLNGINILKIFQDADGILWVGAEEALYKYNQSTDSFYLFTDPGLSIGINNVYNILEDDQKNLWLSVTNGLVRINQKRDEAYLYGAKYGIPAFTDISFMSGYKGEKGELFFGNATGYYAFLPKELKVNNKAPQLNITDFRIDDQPVHPGEASVLQMPLEQKEIRLAYDQNNFSFNFAGIHYSDPQENIHLFMLEGYNSAWRRAGAERIAYYFNVPPGVYVFRVKAASSDGVWAEKAIKVIIIPPWWRTWWFYALCILTVTASIYSLFRYRLNQKLKAFELRNAISRDLHDEVGSTLSSIGFLSSMALDDVNNNNKVKAQNTLSSINESAHKMLDAMNDIIWNIHPENDTIENVIARMISFASQLLEAKKITLYCNVADNVKHLRLNLGVRHDFLLILKEAANNLAKYSAASEAKIYLEFQHPFLILTVSDNGKGFDQQKIKYGNGLKNMQSRAKKIGAVYHLHTSVGQGTTITLKVKPT